MYLLLTRFSLLWYIPKWYFTSPEPWEWKKSDFSQNLATFWRAEESSSTPDSYFLIIFDFFRLEHARRSHKTLRRFILPLLCYSWWIKSKVFNHCYTTSHHLKPHLQLQAWSRTGRRSGRVPCEWHWPAHSVFPWTKEAAGNTFDVMARASYWKKWLCVSPFLPVRHSHDDALHSALTGNVDDCLEGRDEGLTPFQAESFLWRPLPLEELLKPVNKRWRCCFTLSQGSVSPSSPDSQKPHFPHALNAFLGDYRGVLRKATHRPCGSDHPA